MEKKKQYESIARKLIHIEINKIKLKGAILDIGAKESCYSGNNAIKLDIAPYKGVNVVADAHNLPFKDNSFDNVMLIEVLEHLKAPAKAVSEMHRILDKKGKLVLAVPFMYPFHPDPYDYQRFTKQGLEVLLQDFSNIRIIGLGNFIALLGMYFEFLIERCIPSFSRIINIFIYLDKRMPIFKNTVLQYFVEAEK